MGGEVVDYIRGVVRIRESEEKKEKKKRTFFFFFSLFLQHLLY